MTSTFTIGGRLLSPDRPPYVIAEIGINHNGDYRLAVETIQAAAETGADAVKFQTFNADEFMADRALSHEYSTPSGRVRESMHAMFKRLELPAEWHSRLQAEARRCGVEFLSSAADPRAADLLAGLQAPAIKIASEDAINLPLLEHVAGRGLPVILSTGMASVQEVNQAVATLRRGGVPLMLLHCVSLYPTPDEEANLSRMCALRQRYELPVGYSDHTEGCDAAIAATALGAVLIEKHFTLDRGLHGPDHALSADPPMMKRLVASVHRVHRMLGSGNIEPRAAETAARDEFRRSVVAAQRIPPGATITRPMVCLKRPGRGIPPRELPAVIGRRARRAFEPDEALCWDALE